MTPATLCTDIAAQCTNLCTEKPCYFNAVQPVQPYRAPVCEGLRLQMCTHVPRLASRGGSLHRLHRLHSPAAAGVCAFALLHRSVHRRRVSAHRLARQNFRLFDSKKDRRGGL